MKHKKETVASQFLIDSLTIWDFKFPFSSTMHIMKCYSDMSVTTYKSCSHNLEDHNWTFNQSDTDLWQKMHTPRFLLIIFKLLQLTFPAYMFLIIQTIHAKLLELQELLKTSKQYVLENIKAEEIWGSHGGENGIILLGCDTHLLTSL